MRRQRSIRTGWGQPPLLKGSNPPEGVGASPPGGGELRRYTSAVAAMVGVVVLTLVLAAPAYACPVCYGAADNSVIDGAKLSVLFLGALVYVVIGGGVGLVLALRRRVRKNLDSRRGLTLVPPETT